MSFSTRTLNRPSYRAVLIAAAVCVAATSMPSTSSAQFWGPRFGFFPPPFVPVRPVAVGVGIPIPGVVVAPVYPSRWDVRSRWMGYGPHPYASYRHPIAEPVLPAPPVPPVSAATTPHVLRYQARSPFGWGADVQIGSAGDVHVRGVGFEYHAGPMDSPMVTSPDVSGVPGDSFGPQAASPPPVAGSFAAAAEQLARSLRSGVGSTDGDVWLNYLQPDRIVEIARGPSSEGIDELRSLSDRYQGVIANRDLAWLRRLPGFETTRVGLAALVEGAQVAGGPVEGGAVSVNEPAPGTSQEPTLAPEIPADPGPAQNPPGNSKPTGDSQNDPDGQSVLDQTETSARVRIEELPPPKSSVKL